MNNMQDMYQLPFRSLNISFFVLFLFIVASCNESDSVSSELSNEEPNATLTFKIADTVWTHQEVELNGVVSPEIENIEFFLNSDWIGRTAVNDSTWSFMHQFKFKANEAELRIQGTRNDEVLVEVSHSIRIDSLPYLTNVPYYYQYSNAYNPAGSCQNTSIAIVFNYFSEFEQKLKSIGPKSPDYFSNKWGTSKAQSVSGFEDLFNREASLYGLSVRDKGTMRARISDLRSVAASGVPSVVHGYFTGFGHILVVLGFDGEYYYCHDPAGKWSQEFKFGGYSTTNPVEGMYIAYRKAAFEQAVSPDGFVWIHVFE